MCLFVYFSEILIDVNVNFIKLIFEQSFKFKLIFVTIFKLTTMSKIKNKVRIVTPAEQEIGAFNLSNIKTSAELQVIRRKKMRKK